MLPEATKAYSNDSREIVINIYGPGASEKEAVNVFVRDMDTINRWIRRYKEAGSVEPCKRTKCCEKKIIDEALREHVLKSPSAALEERALFFSASISLFMCG